MKKLSPTVKEKIKAIGFSVDWNINSQTDLNSLILDLGLIRIKLREYLR